MVDKGLPFEDFILVLVVAVSSSSSPYMSEYPLPVKCKV